MLLVIGLISAQCSRLDDVSQSKELIPYGISTETQSLDTDMQVTETPLPSPTPTPHIHKVQAGETISYISLLYGVDMAAIMAANPDVNPNAMTVGIQLIIPPRSDNEAGLTAFPTPVAVILKQPNCLRETNGGVWCFLLIENNQEMDVENVTAQIVLGDEKAQQLVARVATAPLNVIPVGESLPLAVHFPPPIPEPFQVGYELQSALPITKEDSRYVEVVLENISVNIAEDGLSAYVEGEIVLGDQDTSVSQVWIAAVAFSEGGEVVGMRRWENVQIINVGSRLPFSFRVYAVGQEIERVVLHAEAQP
jgi:LysM repeat protein